MHFHINKNSKKDLDFCSIDIIPCPTFSRILKFFGVLGYATDRSIYFRIDIGRMADFLEDFLDKE